jgi:hypothetical protein
VKLAILVITRPEHARDVGRRAVRGGYNIAFVIRREPALEDRRGRLIADCDEDAINRRRRCIPDLDMAASPENI